MSCSPPWVSMMSLAGGSSWWFFRKGFLKFIQSKAQQTNVYKSESAVLLQQNQKSIEIGHELLLLNSFLSAPIDFESLLRWNNNYFGIVIQGKLYNMQQRQVGRSKSTTTFARVVSKIEQHLRRSVVRKQNNMITRVQSAFKKNESQSSAAGLPKVSGARGKLHLGKLVKPGIILPAEARHNPWALPAAINQMIISKKGLMDMVNMGMVPKNADFTQLLNHKYEEAKTEKKPNEAKHQENNFFQTNPNIIDLQQNKASKQQFQKESKQVLQAVESEGEKKTRKRVKKGSKLKRDPNLFQFPEVPIILQISNQQVQKTQKYYQQLHKMRRNGEEVAFHQYIRGVENFAVRYGLKKFEFKLLLDETRKMSDKVIKQQIINAKALGVHLAMKGSLRKRVFQFAAMFAMRYRFKKSKRDLQKIENIKRYFKVKKYYQQMTKRRCDLLRFKLGSFAERQRRFLEQSLEKKGANEKFRVQIHILATAAINHEEQGSYYKLEHRNNIQLTRIFDTEPEHLILLMEQPQCDLSPWLKVLAKVKGYHPTIYPIFSGLKNYDVSSYDSIYYGLNSDIVRRVKQICRKTEDICVYPSAYCGTVVKICEIFNAKLYCSSFWRPQLNKLLQQENQVAEERMYLSFKIEMASKEDSIKKNQQITVSNRSTPRNVSMQLIKSRVGPRLQGDFIRTEAQMRHMYQKWKMKDLNMIKLTNEHYSNKLIVKRDILLAHCETPHSVVFQPGTEDKYLYRKLTEVILENKSVNKWVFKIGASARFSRGIAFLETDSLKILKEKKKKIDLNELDIAQVANIMKVILIDKLQIPQSSLLDSTIFVTNFMKTGGYMEALIAETSTECVFGKITPVGSFEVFGTYSKIYTDEVVNCAGLYPSKVITGQQINQVKQLAARLYEKHQILGFVTFEMLIQKRTKKCYFIDLVLNLQQYSSLYFMYTCLFNNLDIPEQSLTVLRKVGQKKGMQRIQDSKTLTREAEKGRLNSVESMTSEKHSGGMELKRDIVYIPFIDNNGNIYHSFQQFQEACQMRQIRMLNFQQVQGLHFLYLNLKDQRPDVLSLLVFSKSSKKALKYTMEGLNFLTDSGERTNKFDKKVERRNYDCLYIHDIVWKFRELKKLKDSSPVSQQGQKCEK